MPHFDFITIDIDRAVAALRAGGLVGLPTETVYGLAADASNDAAVDRIFSAKGRPRGHPLILHVADLDTAERCGVFSDVAHQLAERFRPGPMTLLVPRTSSVSDTVTGGRDSVGIRIPAHPVAAEVLRRHGGALAAPSANRFGEVSPTTAQHVVADLGGHLDPDLDLVLDGGPCTVGVESSIIDTTCSPVQLLRPGAVTADDLDTILASLAGPSGPSRAAGMMAAHYAPACAVHAVDHDGPLHSLVVDGVDVGAAHTRVLDLRDNHDVAARELYSHLRAADIDGIDAVVVLMPPATGLGAAIRDRVMKAAAGRQPPAD